MRDEVQTEGRKQKAEGSELNDRPLPSAFCISLLPSASCFLPTAFCFLPSAFRLFIPHPFVRLTARAAAAYIQSVHLE